MLVKEYVTSLETNAAILGVVALSMKHFVERTIQRANNSGSFDPAGLSALRAECLRYLKSIAIEGVPLEQEATVLNEALVMFEQMIDHAVAAGMA